MAETALDGENGDVHTSNGNNNKIDCIKVKTDNSTSQSYGMDPLVNGIRENGEENKENQGKTQVR